MKERRVVANVEEHPKGSGKYRVRAREEGKLVTIASKLSKAEAEETANAYQNVRAASELREGVDLKTFGIGFFDRRERSGVRAIRTDRSRWAKHVARDPIGALPVSTLVRRDIVEWRNRLVGEHRSRVRNLNLLRVALDDAVELGLLESNPAREVRIHRSGAARDTDDLDGILTLPEQLALLTAVPKRERPLVAFALLTGLRQAEQWWLRWEDVFSDPPRVLVRRSTGGLPPKGGKPREVGLFPSAVDALAEMPRRRSGFIFSGARGARRGEGKAPLAWARWVKAAGIERHVRWHDLRHTCATSLLAGWWGRKWTLDEVCQLLGHSSVTVTERYARKLNETQRLAIAQTPTLMFPGGNTGVPMLATSQELSGAFVKHRSSVQARLSAPVVSASHGERAGNIDEEEADFLVALGEHLGAVPGGGLP